MKKKMSVTIPSWAQPLMNQDYFFRVKKLDYYLYLTNPTIQKLQKVSNLNKWLQFHRRCCNEETCHVNRLRTLKASQSTVNENTTVNEPTVPQTRNPQTVIMAPTFQLVEIRIVEIVEIGYYYTTHIFHTRLDYTHMGY